MTLWAVLQMRSHLDELSSWHWQKNMACVNLGFPSTSAGLSSLLLALWPQFLSSHISITEFHSPFCFPLAIDTHIKRQTVTHPKPGAAPPCLSSSVHLLPAWQHCLLQDREHVEDSGSFPPLSFGEVIGHHIIWGKKRGSLLSLDKISLWQKISNI